MDNVLKIRNIRWFLLSLMFLFIGKLYAQEFTVHGTIKSSNDDEALPGVSVLIKGITQGTITNVNGDYQIEVNPGDILVYSYVGYITEEIQIQGQSRLDIAMVPDLTELEEIVVTGYSAQKKKDLTGAVSVVKMDEVKDLPAGNIMKNIQGRLAGVSVTTDGSPGSTATIRIRGTGSLNNNDPLYVIDGVPTKKGMHELNPNDIESVQVLKDAASASIYGSRAANGVIVITTKKAKSQGVRVNVDANWSVQQFTSKLNPLNTQQRGEVFWQASVNAGLKPDSS